MPGMSIWGKRVDSWFTERTGGGGVTHEEWNRRGLNFLWQAALVGGFALIVWLLGAEIF
jgi:hypothetical protein